jgi:hypothetical protein
LRKTGGRSLAYTNFRRAANVGKIYLILSVAISILISAEFSFIHANSSASSVVPSFVSALPALILPAFTVIGSFGSLMIFVSDKDRGVYEYLIAYGVNPSKIFWSIVAATVGLVSIVLAIDISINLGATLVSGGVSITYLELIFFYMIPISYAMSMFMSMVGMIWSFLAVRRTGINSPVGVVSIIGIIPVFIVLLVSLALPPGYMIYFAGSVSIALFVAVGFLIRLSNQKLVRERFLSNA